MGKISVLGGHKGWDRLRRSNAPALVGALYRIGPVDIWRRGLYGVLTSGMKEKETQEELGEVKPRQ